MIKSELGAVARIIIVSVLFAVHCGASAQQAENKDGFTVKGRITENPSGVPLEYATVALYSQADSSLVEGTITGSGGYFELKPNKPGRYYVIAKFLGYLPSKTAPFQLEKKQMVHQLGSISLKVEDIGIEEVSIVGERPAVSYKIDRKVIDVSGNTALQGGTAIDALQNLPSVQAKADGSVSLRGSTNFTVMIDGRQSQLTGGDALAQIPASAISKIELITNPSAKYDPDGTSGIINIITKKGLLRGHSLVANASAGNSPSASADATYTYQAAKYSLLVNAGCRSSRVDYQNSDTRTYLNAPASGAEKIETDQDGSQLRSNYFARVGGEYFITPANTLSAGAGIEIMQMKRWYDGRTLTQDTAGMLSRDGSYYKYGVGPVQFQCNIGDKHIFGENDSHFITADVTYQTSQRNKADEAHRFLADENWVQAAPASADDKSTTKDRFSSIRSELSYTRPLTGEHSAETGLSARHDQYRQDYERWSLIDATGRYTDTAHFERTIVAVYAIAKGPVLGMQYSAGLRAEQTDQQVRTDRTDWDYTYRNMGWYPSMSLTRQLSETSTLQASYSRRINRPRDQHTNPFPNISDGYVQQLPNPQLQPEYATSLELNFQKSHNAQQFTAESFYRYTDNKITRISTLRSDTVVYTSKNIGSETDAGIELSVNLKIGKWYSIQPVYTVSWNAVEGEYSGKSHNSSSIFMRGNITHTVNLWRSARLQFMSYYEGKRNTIDGKKMPMVWFAAAVKQDFLDRRLTVSLRGEDIFSTRKQRSYTYSDDADIYSMHQHDGCLLTLAASYRFNREGKHGKDAQNSKNSDSGDMEY